MTWYSEKLHDGIGQRFEISRVLFEERTEHQDLVIFENPVFGRILALDGAVQTTERDEFVYHEMLVHVPVMAHGAARRILIVGGGDGGALREALKHKSVERAVVVEIDRSVVDLCTEYMPSLSAGAFSDPRAEIVIQDAAEYVAETDERFDVIAVDSTDPVGPSLVLYQPEFYRACRRLLGEKGIVTTMSGVPFLQPKSLKLTVGNLRQAFAHAGFYVAPVPTYYGGHMAFGFATDSAAALEVAAGELERRFAAAPFATRYYTPAGHKGAFAVPRFAQAILE